jgi:hypothetical protein
MIPPGPFLTNIGRHGSAANTLAARVSGSNDTNGFLWTAANRALYCPVWLGDPFPFIRIFWANGIAVAGTIDAGIYTEDFTRIFSVGDDLGGVVAQAGVSAPQAVTCDATLQGEALYYFALSCSVNTARLIGPAFGDPIMNRMVGGCMIEEAAHPLPATANPIAIGSGTVSSMPVIGLSNRALV